MYGNLCEEKRAVSSVAFVEEGYIAFSECLDGLRSFHAAHKSEGKLL